MRESSLTWRSDLYGILPHPSEPWLLMLPTAAGWSLPHIALDKKVRVANVGEVNEAMRRTLGVDLTTLRSISYTMQEEEQHIDAVYVLESQSPAWEPPDGAAWVGRAVLSDLPLMRPEHQALIAAHLAETESGQIPERRPPWARVGWFAQAAAWTRSELTRLGYHLTAPVEQVRSWGLSCILRARTTSGDVYFKVAPDLPLFAHEPVLMRGLSRLYPAHIPAPLSIDEPRRWMLLADFGAAIEWGASVAVQEEMLRHYGALQRAAVPRVDELLRWGAWTAALIGSRHRSTRCCRTQRHLPANWLWRRSNDSERTGRASRRSVPSWRRYAVPSTLVHGDLHLGNVARLAGRYLFFDWTDGCVAHPFFDTISIFQIKQAKDPGVQARLRDSYLGVWTAYEPIERLREAWTLAKPLCALHQAVSYQHIVTALEDSAQPAVASGLPYWVRQLLQALE